MYLFAADGATCRRRNPLSRSANDAGRDQDREREGVGLEEALGRGRREVAHLARLSVPAEESVAVGAVRGVGMPALAGDWARVGVAWICGWRAGVPESEGGIGGTGGKGARRRGGQPRREGEGGERRTWCGVRSEPRGRE